MAKKVRLRTGTKKLLATSKELRTAPDSSLHKKNVSGRKSYAAFLKKTRRDSGKKHPQTKKQLRSEYTAHNVLGRGPYRG